ncbi:MAG: BatA domain-containing protein [Gemmatimonadota bacterium]|nr:BatA domain-containing protein [Gemmatimonadota bacterium]
MTFLAPAFLTAAVIAAACVAVLHFIVTRRPRAVLFPTARFVPEVPSTARSRSVRLSDLLLLMVRVLTIILVGAALARPIFPPHRERIARVILADISGSVASRSEVRDSVRTQFRRGDAIVMFDTIARTTQFPDSIPVHTVSRSPGALSAAMIAALRAGSQLRNGADSLELVFVSPVAISERDRATAGIRSLWRGRARIIQVATPRSADSGAAGGVAALFATGSRPMFAVARTTVDTARAVVSSDNVVVGHFERRWRFTSDSLARSRVVARWADGEPAAIARYEDHGCALSVAIPMDSTGDIPLSPEVRRLTSALSRSCEHAADKPDTSLPRTLAGAGSLASAASFPPAQDVDSPLSRWLAIAAIVLAIGEMVLRRTRDGTIES